MQLTKEYFEQHLEKVLGEKLDPIQKGIGTLNTDVSGLKTDVSELKTDVSGLKADVSELKTDVSGLKADVSELKTDVASLKDSVSNLETVYNSLKLDVSEIKETVKRIDERDLEDSNSLAKSFVVHDKRISKLEKLIRPIKLAQS